METTTLPDERGYFGAYGGRYVPETLMPALEELSAGYAEAMADTSIHGGLDATSARLRGQADIAFRRAKPHQALRRRKDTPEAGGFGSHRRP